MRASFANNSFVTASPFFNFTIRKCGVKAVVVLQLLTIAAGVMAGSEPTSESHPVEMGFQNLLSLSHTTRLDSWGACLEAAERARSTRDAEFFRSSRTLSDAKGWFISHSLTNERLFCSDIKACEEGFYKRYSLVNGSYPACEA